MNDFQTKYLAEAGQRIRYAGFTVSPEKDGLLPVEWAGHRVCNVNGNGGMTYDPEHIWRNGLEDALDRVREIVGETLAYMRQMETAPPLLAEGLSGDYRLLAEFNHIVLAGHAREGGYVAYRGILTIEQLMRQKSEEQCQREPQMGGFS